MSINKRNNTAEELWLRHDTYKPSVSTSFRITTRSQAAFVKIKNSDSDLKLFADSSKHHPPNKCHLISKMKGELGSIPRTILTRSTADHLFESKQLCEALQDYKKYIPPEVGGEHPTETITSGTGKRNVFGKKVPTLSQLRPPKDHPEDEKRNEPQEQASVADIPPLGELDELDF